MADGFGENFARGMAVGVEMFDSAQKRKRQEAEDARKDQEWERQDTERKQMSEAVMARTAAEQGNYGPTIHWANSRGIFGEGTTLHNTFERDGQVFGNFTDKDNNLVSRPVGKSMSQLANAAFVGMLPPAAAANLLAKQAEQSGDPVAQAQIRNLQITGQVKQKELDNFDADKALERERQLAGINATNIGAANTAQNMRESAELHPLNKEGKEAETALKKRQTADPLYGVKPAGRATYYTDEGDVTVNLPPGDPRLNPQAMQHSAPAAVPATPPSTQQQAAAPVDPKAMYQSLVKSGVSTEEARRKVMETFGER